MQQEHPSRARLFGLRLSRRQRSLLIFGSGLALVLLLGLQHIVANPDQVTSDPQGAVIISEFGAAGNGPADEYGEYPDWIELHNRSLTTVNLKDWSLTDDPTQLDKWRFGDVSLGPDQYLIVFASGRDHDEIDANHPYLHTSFRLHGDGGFLALIPPNARQYVDGTAYQYPAQSPQHSYGLVQDSSGKWTPRYLDHPTPGGPNDTSMTWGGVLPEVKADVPHGFYEAPFKVALSTVVAGAHIFYTLDDSTPNDKSGIPYTQPIEITQTTALRAVAYLPDFAPSPILTQSYIFLADVDRQPANPPGWPATWGKYCVCTGPFPAGQPVQADYAMDPRIVNDPANHDLNQGLLAIPSISLVTDMSNLDIFITPQERGVQTERPVSIEWIDPQGNDDGFQVNAGFRIQGNAGRLEYIPKHPLRLFFRQEYGAAKLNYPIFPNSFVSQFETLTLRAGVNESFAGDFVDAAGHLNLREITTYLRDEWTRDTQVALSGVGSHGRFVHLYINGLYWGLYNIVERPDSSFSYSYFGGEEDDWSSFNHGGPVYGSEDRFKTLLNLARAGDLQDPAKYATFNDFLNVPEFMDYLLINWYGGNFDWPETNWYATVESTAGRTRFWTWDAEKTFYHGAQIRIGGEPPGGAPYPNVVKLLFYQAWSNPDFRMAFADRLFHAVYGNGALTDASAMARWQKLKTPLNSAIVAESARWGDVRYKDPITRSDWEAANAGVLNQMKGNGARLLEQARERGFYPMIDPPTISLPTGTPDGELPQSIEFTGTQEITLAAPKGIIYYTTDGSDPRASGTGEITGTVSATAIRYSEPVVISTTGSLKTRLLVDGVWSALNEANFTKQGEAAHVVISEIMYNPYLDENMEFLELKNVGNTAADLSGAYFFGIDFRFGDNVILRPGQHLVLIKSLRNFRQRYPNVEIAGQYVGKLSDKGETLILYHPDGKVWFQVTYHNNNGWPLSAKGAGDSLELIDPKGDVNSPHDWRASPTLYGTPGTDEPAQCNQSSSFFSCSFVESMRGGS